MDGIIGEKRARSWEIDEISAFDVLKILNTMEIFILFMTMQVSRL